MTLRVVAPPIGAVLALYAEQRPLKPIEASAAILQAARAEILGFEVVDDCRAGPCGGAAGGSGLVAAALLYPRDDAPVDELLFVCRPAAARHLTAIVKTARLIRARLADTPGLTVRATVRAGHRPGQRLAALCGLALVNKVGGFEHWEWSTCGSSGNG